MQILIYQIKFKNFVEKTIKNLLRKFSNSYKIFIIKKMKILNQNLKLANKFYKGK